MSGRLAGKVALITGAGSGIAKAASRIFAEEGARIALFLAADESRMITGAIIPADGGRSAY
jgi:NAD(P)-dependent dehydrogenase (short-subunit alcohol dehydrogenase family)